MKNAMERSGVSFACLSIRNPAAELILDGIKTVENRSRRFFDPKRYKLPLWVLVHAGIYDMEIDDITKDLSLREKLGRRENSTIKSATPRGRVVGMMEIVAAEPKEEVVADRHLPWVLGPWCLEIGQTHWLPQPIAKRGNCGIFYVSSEELGDINVSFIESRDNGNINLKKRNSYES